MRLGSFLFVFFFGVFCFVGSSSCSDFVLQILAVYRSDSLREESYGYARRFFLGLVSAGRAGVRFECSKSGGQCGVGGGLVPQTRPLRCRLQMGVCQVQQVEFPMADLLDALTDGMICVKGMWFDVEVRRRLWVCSCEATRNVVLLVCE